MTNQVQPSKTLFSVHDSKSDFYYSPVSYRSRGEALRAFETACKDENSQFNKYPSDFTFVELGQFCEFTGTLIPHEKPIILINASDYIQ